MGIFADLITSGLSFSTSGRTIQQIQKYQSRIDPAVPTAFAEADAVHSLAVDTVDHTGGTFTLKITLRGGFNFTTAAIAYNANAATIEAAIDTAATTASTPGWTNSDISVGGGANLQSATPMTLTFDGNSVDGTNHPITVFTDSMTGGTSPATRVSITTPGQSQRTAWAALYELGVISTSSPSTQSAPSNVTAGGNLLKVEPWFIRELAQQAAYEDQNKDTYDRIVEPVLGLDDRAKLILA